MSALLLLQAAGEQAAEHAAAATEHAAAEGAAHGANPAEVLMHHVTDSVLYSLNVGPLHLVITKHLIYFVIAAVVVLVATRLAIRSYREGGVPTGIGAAVESLVLFIRDEIAETNIGHDGRVFVPLLCSFFFFILFAALLGLMPFPVRDPSSSFGFNVVSATSTGNISVTLGLAFVAFCAMQYAGIKKYGVFGHLKNLVPPGLPMWLLPIMIPVEILGIFTKPFALMVRLFANMLAGHMVITVLLMLIPLLAALSKWSVVAVAPVSLLLALFIMLLELLVALIQAYIFTLLTAIFIGMFAHPAH